MPAVSVVNRSGNTVETLELRDEVFAAQVNVPLMHQAAVRHLADQRVGTAATKNRALVSGGGKKPWRQKGTGRARAGSIRSPLWRGGGTVFGPQPKSYDQEMPRKARRSAIRSALSDKLASGQVTVVDRVEVAQPKTKLMAGFLHGLGVKGSALLVVPEISENLGRASRNLPHLLVVRPGHLSVYELLNRDRVIFQRDAILAVQEALAK